MKLSSFVASIALTGIFYSGLSGISQAAVPSPEQQAKIHTERMLLEQAKKESLNQCNQFKESNPENFARCKSEHVSRFDADIDQLMRNPDDYFARKQKRNHPAGKK